MILISVCVTLRPSGGPGCKLHPEEGCITPRRPDPGGPWGFPIHSRARAHSSEEQRRRADLDACWEVSRAVDLHFWNRDDSPDTW